MNQRIEREKTFEGQLAVIARVLVERAVTPFPYKPDIADFRDAFRRHCARWQLIARIDQGKISAGGTFQQVMELQKELERIEKEILDNPL